MTPRNTLLTTKLYELYKNHQENLLFHGWHHIQFVTRKALEFADELQADKEIVEAAALTHDINYIVDTKSGVDAGKQLRSQYLYEVGYSKDEVDQIEVVVHTASTANRNADISDVAKCISDADSLFKVLPVGPIILSARFISETRVDLKKWADRIIQEQKPLLERGIYFYTQTAKSRYLTWAQVNLQLIELIQQSLDDPDIQLFLDDCRLSGLLPQS